VVDDFESSHEALFSTEWVGVFFLLVEKNDLSVLFVLTKTFEDSSYLIYLAFTV
jgi:hypothetical protein